ncbi:G2/mitotic-specific cyclin [Didymosphaeria variabile]|uniref:G2/mitotic-specific cyclin n=1 Tax=Didymosphaeria variabile TaxID=1932322 RepID=A0A9W8XK14_9PLEO|nr:G2/mitotic-specific cyclin [Didymosphaeria variabile]KAJ4353290.1 G2/mitotic-specific cyclin [Didymosphaeria variabile]
MPPAARNLRQRAITNENDENVGTQRLTRAKSAAMDSVVDVPKKQALNTKKSQTALAPAGQARKRVALGDRTNSIKTEAVGAGAKDAKEMKKPSVAKSGLAQAAHPTKVMKTSQKQPRSVLAPKEKNANSSGSKRPAPGSGIAGPMKKRQHSAPDSVKEDPEEEENIEPPTNIKVEDSKAAPKSKDVPVAAQVTETEVEVIPDLDKEDVDDPLMVSEYVGEIFEYLKELEIATMANPDYMDNQTELEWKMRGILVDWLLEVHTRFRLLPETLFLAVNIIDRFLSTKVVQLDRLQLVGVTAMFIASKYEEVLSPHVQNFRHVADDGFTEEEILSAERFVLSALDYDLSYPNPMNFLRRISKADNYDIQTRTLGKYLLEIGCLDHRFIAHPPSQVAAAAMYLSRMVLDRGAWDATLSHYAGYTDDEIQPVLELMIDYLSGPVLHEAFFKKYASKKFMKASIVLRSWCKKYVAQYGNPLQDTSKA